MKEYLKQTLPRLESYSKSLSKKAQLTDKTWRLINVDGSLEEFTFTWQNDVYRTGKGGTTTKGKWKLLASTNQLDIDFGARDQYLLKTAFLDDTILILSDALGETFMPFISTSSAINSPATLINYVETKTRVIKAEIERKVNDSRDVEHLITVLLLAILITIIILTVNLHKNRY